MPALREMSDTPETDDLARGNHVVPTEWAQQLERERDEARAVANELANIASHCLGWHDHESTETAEKLTNALKRWRNLKTQ